MNERQKTREGRQDRWTSQVERDPEGNEGSQQSMSRSPQRAGELQQGARSSGDWTGYVVPYSYYGPGYRGVGYYSVFYQGTGDEQGIDADWDESGRGRSQHQDAGTGRSSAAYGGSGASGYGGSDYGGAGGYGGPGRGGYSSGRGYSGRGPKGYQRSDERIQEEVNDRLMADDRIDASDIEVQVHDGEVTLTGSVADRWAKRMAEDLVEQVMGVHEVMNQIRVSQGQGGQSGQTSQTNQTGQSGRTSQTGQSQTQGDSNGRRQKAGSAPR